LSTSCWNCRRKFPRLVLSAARNRRSDLWLTPTITPSATQEEEKEEEKEEKEEKEEEKEENSNTI